MHRELALHVIDFDTFIYTNNASSIVPLLWQTIHKICIIMFNDSTRLPYRKNENLPNDLLFQIDFTSNIYEINKQRTVCSNCVSIVMCLMETSWEIWMIWSREKYENLQWQLWTFHRSSNIMLNILGLTQNLFVLFQYFYSHALRCFIQFWFFIFIFQKKTQLQIFIFLF